jgi:hypothetical protein
MKFNPSIPVYGDTKWRGPCPTETAEQVTLFQWLRMQYPHSYGLIALHPRNEGKRHHAQTIAQKAEGLAVGAPDIIIPGSPTILCELKRRDHTKSSWQDGQQEYLIAAQDAGAIVGVALGWEAAILFLKKHLQRV